MPHSRIAGTGLPTDLDIKTADQLRSILASAPSDKDGGVTLRIADPGGGIEEITLTHDLAEKFRAILRLISSGKGFRVIPYEAELTTQQAADFLNVSRPYLIKLLEAEEIKHTKVGRHRRVKAEELFLYKEKRDKDRSGVLAELAEEDAEHL